MAQLHVYVSSDIEKKAHRLAKEQGVSVSRYLARLLERELAPGWPDGYFDDVVGSWEGDELERPSQGDLPGRDPFRDEVEG